MSSWCDTLGLLRTSVKRVQRKAMPIPRDQVDFVGKEALDSRC